jgi:hypothetical protein
LGSQFNKVVFMTNTSYISIKDASDLSGKSIQTIRRLIKSKKVKFKKDRTPQGFNYLIDEQSFCAFYNIQRADTARKIEPRQAEDTTVQQAQTTTITPAEIKQESALVVKKDHTVVEFDIANEFNGTIQKLIDQHGKEKENLFKLVETFQNKVISLENKLKVETLSKKSWYKFW